MRTDVSEPRKEWGRAWRLDEDWMGFTEKICG